VELNHQKVSFSEKIKTSAGRLMDKIIYREKRPFVEKREFNLGFLKWASIMGVGITVAVILVLPPSESISDQKTGTKENSQRSSNYSSNQDGSSGEETLAQLEAANRMKRKVPGSLDYLYSQGGGGGHGGSGGDKDRSASMILVQSGGDTKNSLPAGTRIRTRLMDGVTVGGDTMPVMGSVVTDIMHEGSVAITRGSALLGEASFDDSLGRAKIQWRSIRLLDGRERQIASQSLGMEGNPGISGIVRSDAIKNTLGKSLTTFVGAFAQGSMQSGVLGAQEGGFRNGVKNAISETAQDRAEAFGEDLKEERKWIELSAGTEFVSVLNQSFIFRDPGAFHGSN